MKNGKGISIVHPFLLAAYPCFFLLSVNPHRLILIPILTIMLTFILCALFLFILWNFILRSKAKAGIITSLFISWLFFFKPIFLIVNKWTAIGWFYLRYPHALLIWTILFGAMAAFVILTRCQFRRPTKVLNLLAVSLIIFSFVNLIFSSINKFSCSLKNIKAAVKQEEAPDNRQQECFTPGQAMQDFASPDIYYIILDSYTSFHVLKRFYDFDAYAYSAYLQKKGFFIAGKSRSNYENTPLSMTSSLNFRYLDKKKAEITGFRLNVFPREVKNNRVSQFLKARGYKIINVGFYNEFADINFNAEAQRCVFRTTLTTNSARL